MPQSFTETLNTYLAQTHATQILLAIIFALFVVWQFIRSFGGRDKTLNAVTTQLSLVIAQQLKRDEKRDEEMSKRDEEYRRLFKEIVDHGDKTDSRWQGMIEQNTDTQLRHAIAVEALNKTAEVLAVSTNSTSILLVDHDRFARGGVADILKALERVEASVATIEKKVDLLFPRHEEFKTEFDELRAAVARCADEVKRATDEKPVAFIPLEPTPETAEKLTPGSEAAA